ncbi:DUF6274 family protein [Streptomyces sp. ITFR-16]|uniref:DUF6274 family protein n=1 Tax=Streptomyces sp. ITFR-16 TaxID=3075198 RepID=UPI00288B5724|nr:DUF6274 family protein [Streptomyces sp. ITFR-16]WNI23461.1 DUF6274 family protein [Streptomyces sp. ITFR-16]
MTASTDEGFRSERPDSREPGRERARAPRHEIRALLRAHLAAATGYRHLTRHCAVCARLLRLAMEPAAASRGVPVEPVPGLRDAEPSDEPSRPAEPPTGRREGALPPPGPGPSRAPGRPSGAEDESPPAA